ncbi:uncharacterized protein [Coffea arabica]
MEQNNEDVEQLNYNEERADEMSEEEIEMIEDDTNEGGQQVDRDGGAGPFEKKKRKKKSSIWDEMSEVVLDNGTVKVKCNHCKELFTKSATGATSQYKRHLNSRLQRKMAIGEQSKQKQQVLSFTEGGSDGITSITNFSYDHAKRQVVKKRQNEGSSSSSKKQKMAAPTVLTGKEKFHMHVSEIDRALPEKSDLDVYLEESRYACDANANLDVLAWWKGERLRFPILSRMAADILSVPVTTMASDSTFSAGGRVIDDRRASMSVETVQMLLCGNDWIRSLHGLKNKSRESLDAAESITFEEVELPESFTS